MTPKSKRYAAVAALSLITLMSLSAHGAGPTLVITDAGYQIMSVGADGKAVLQDVGQVVDLRGNAPGPVPGPTPPPPGETDPIASKVSGWAKDVGDPTGAHSLATVYEAIGKSSQGQSREKVLGALRQATDAVLSATQSAEKWKPWRDKVSALIDAEEAKGPIDWPKFCASVSKGLKDAAPAMALDPALLTLIINLIMQIIQMFFGGGGTGV